MKRKKHMNLKRKGKNMSNRKILGKTIIDFNPMTNNVTSNLGVKFRDIHNDMFVITMEGIDDIFTIRKNDRVIYTTDNNMEASIAMNRAELTGRI